ncbi:MAG TPA: TetR/AcrR family transcriptional regulator [Polyangiaceae bacterium]|nr:TetR/AcrR family transcriptional regulator [Polyangiaceae bacterium]
MTARAAASRPRRRALPKPRPVRESVREDARGAYRESILAAAERVFTRAGFYETRMADIAKEAGVGVGTLYNYFESKELIFSEILATKHGEFKTAVEGSATAEDAVERLRQMVRGSFACLEDHGGLYAIFMERGAVGESDVERLVSDKAARGYTEFLEMLEKTIRAAVRAKQIRGDLDVKLLVAALSGSMNGAIYQWFKRGRRGRLSEITDELVDLFLNGARTQ